MYAELPAEESAYALADGAGKVAKRSKTKQGNDQDALYALADEKAQRTGAAPGQDDMYAMANHKNATIYDVASNKPAPESMYAIADSVAQRSKPAPGVDDMYAMANRKHESDYAEAANHATESDYALADATAQRTGPAPGQEDMYAGVPATDRLRMTESCGGHCLLFAGTYVLSDTGELMAESDDFGFGDAPDGYLKIDPS